tara:strand:- start:312 stop:569 length:258 start_codon:yes stop_codon:yes gene_type:complete
MTDIENNLYTAEHFGITFYEHPIHGEMTPMLVKRGGMFYETELYDPPCSAEEAKEQRDNALKTDPAFEIVLGAYEAVDHIRFNEG